MSANRADGTAVPDGLRAGLVAAVRGPGDRSGGQGGCLSLWVGFCVWLCGWVVLGVVAEAVSLRARCRSW